MPEEHSRYNQLEATVYENFQKPLNFTKDNSYYMCPRCMVPFYHKSDMARHIYRKTPCKHPLSHYTNKITEEKAYQRYYFYGVTTLPTLTTRQKRNMISKLNSKINIIYDTNILYNPNRIDYEHTISGHTDMITALCRAMITEVEKVSDYPSMNECVLEQNGTVMIECKRCKLSFTSISQLTTHMSNRSLCDERCYERKSLCHHLSQYHAMIESMNFILPYPTIEVCDFFKDNYVITHINYEFIHNRDISDMSLFLSYILSNDRNKNVYIDTENDSHDIDDSDLSKIYAYVYTDGKICRLPMYKVCYVMMEKVVIAMEEYIQSNPLIHNCIDDYLHIIDYYRTEVKNYKMNNPLCYYDMTKREYHEPKPYYITTRDMYIVSFRPKINYNEDRTKYIFDTNDTLSKCTRFEDDYPYIIPS
jgi:hypothetical protein